jgi:Protein of unknown function (DUF3237)
MPARAILAGGADFQLVRPDHTAEFHARYVLELDDGVRIYVENSGLATARQKRWNASAAEN